MLLTLNLRVDLPIFRYSFWLCDNLLSVLTSGVLLGSGYLGFGHFKNSYKSVLNEFT